MVSVAFEAPVDGRVCMGVSVWAVVHGLYMGGNVWAAVDGPAVYMDQCMGQWYDRTGRPVH